MQLRTLSESTGVEPSAGPTPRLAAGSCSSAARSQADDAQEDDIPCNVCCFRRRRRRHSGVGTADAGRGDSTPGAHTWQSSRAMASVDKLILRAGNGRPSQILSRDMAEVSVIRDAPPGECRAILCEHFFGVS